jgi:glycosyltransferase involved in cell wall biosynthesis
MHIAWLGKKSPFCGNVTYSREVTNALRDRGHQVSFFHFAQDDPPPDNWPEFEDPDMQEIFIPFLYKSQVYTIPSLTSRKILYQALKNLKPDVVHASLTLSPLDFVLPEICAELRIPLVATFHLAFDHQLRNITSGAGYLTYQLYAPFLAKYDRVIVFSHLQRNVLVRQGVPRSRISVIPNGVDTEKYCPGPSNLKAELNADRIFVYQGRIAPEKNVESMLKAWKHSNMGRRSKLLIVGNHGSLAASLQPFYGPEHGIVWMGFIGDERRRIEILRGSDVFVLPSLVEGLSLSLLEAMACGLACVATDAGSDGEVLEKEAGIILKTQNVTSQLKVLFPHLRDHASWTETLGQRARQRTEDRYTISTNISRLEQLYSTVVEKSKPLLLERA